MPTIKKSALVPFPATAMFDLVASVEEYPEFLPWCGGTEIHQRTEDGMVATIRIAYRGLSQSFTTENRHDRPHRIELKLAFLFSAMLVIGRASQRGHEF